ncbi:MAG: hypothetical protein ABUS51_10755 [Acidobacteriota bacterium]
MLRCLVALALVASSLRAQHVGSETCARCHGEISARYAKTPMGRSMARADTARVELPGTSGAYRVFEKDGALYQAANGGNPWKLELVIGSGVNGQTFLIRRGAAFVEAPLTYYNRAGKWGLSPGYEQADAGFSRIAPEACLACHSASPRVDPDDLAIGCESCHGPGGRHAARPARANIVNPARLDKRLSEDICMYCHQGGATRIPQPGKHYEDFVPGQPLNRTLAIFRLPDAQDADLLEHHAAMRLSKCYRSSGGAMNCLTCHDPHGTVNYNQRCAECHGTLAHPPGGGADCVACHMPKRSVTQVSHAALTSHRILAKPGEGLPAPDSSIYFNGDMAHLPALTKLAAYGELGMRKEYLEVLDTLAKTMPNDPLVRASLGRRALLEGRVAEAIEYLRDTSQAVSLLDLAQALKLAGRQPESVPVLERAAALEPLDATVRKTLILAYIEKKDYISARTCMEKYVLDFPEDALMRNLLAKVSSR